MNRENLQQWLHLRRLSRVYVRGVLHAGEYFPGLSVIGRRCIVPTSDSNAQCTPIAGYSSSYSLIDGLNLTFKPDKYTTADHPRKLWQEKS